MSLRSIYGLVGFVGLFASGFAVAEPIVLPTYDVFLTDPAMSELRTDVVTPHTPWAKRYAGRSLRVVAIAPRWSQRASVELIQRFSFDLTAIMTIRSHTWGDRDAPHYAWIAWGTESLVTVRALEALADTPDVIVLGWLDTKILPEAVEAEIIAAARAGVGLVLFSPKAVSPGLETLIQQYGDPEPTSLHAVVDGIPSRRLPPLDQAPRSLIGNGIRFCESVAGGRIAIVDYEQAPANYPKSGSETNSYLSPAAVDAMRDIHHDYFCAVAGRTILWASDNMPAVRLTGWEALTGDVDGAGPAVTWGALWVEPPSGGVVELVVRDVASDVALRMTQRVGAEGRVPLETDAVKAGGHYLDVILRDVAGRTLDWGSCFFTVKTGAQITTVTAPKEACENHASVPVTAALAGDFNGADVRVEARDTHGRLVWVGAAQAASEMTSTVPIRRGAG